MVPRSALDVASTPGSRRAGWGGLGDLGAVGFEDDLDGFFGVVASQTPAGPLPGDRGGPQQLAGRFRAGRSERMLDDADPTLTNFLKLLIENHRMPVIFRIRQEYERLWDEENRTLPVEITSAIALDEQTTASLGKTIGERAGRKVTLAARVDPDILGGIIIRVGNSILDASIRNRLEQLRRHVAQGAS